MRTGKNVKTLMILILLLVLATPTAVFAGLNGEGDSAAGEILMQEEGEGEEGSAQEGSGSDATGFVLGFLGGIIFLIIAVVAILGAVGLGLIGIGYWSVEPSEE